MRGLKADKAMTIEDVGNYNPGLRSRVPLSGSKPWLSTRPTISGLGELDRQEKIAIGAGAGLVAWWLIATDKEKYTPEQLKAMAKTQKGSPTDTPGQKLPGEPDYVKIYLGQHLNALTKFGVGEFGSPSIAVTPRSYAVEILEFWTREINRLCGNDSRLAFQQPVKWDDNANRGMPVRIAGYVPGIVSFESATAILSGWNKIRPKLRAAMFDGVGVGNIMSLTKPLSVTGAREFWYQISKLSIVVDVDRAVPDHSGYAWVAIRNSFVELPGIIGDAALSIVKAAGGFGLSVLLAGVKGVLFSPIGVLAGVGAVAYFYSRRKSQGRLAFMVQPRKSKRRKRR